jgi:hypothetical protein
MTNHPPIDAGSLRDDAGLVKVADAARLLGIEEKRLRGFIARDNLEDPIGDMHYVLWDWRCWRLSASPSAAP